MPSLLSASVALPPTDWFKKILTLAIGLKQFASLVASHMLLL